MCNIFFDPGHPQWQDDLKDRDFDAAGWCKEGLTITDLRVAANATLHELSHLNDPAQRARMPAHGCVF